MSARQRLRITAFDPPAPPAPEPEPAIKIGKTVSPRTAPGGLVLSEVFTMTVGGETIPLVPLKTWAQLDEHKWRARGILPATPAGLEIKWDHVKVGGVTVSPWEANGCAKLEAALNQWLEVEQQAVASAKPKQWPSAEAHPTPVASEEHHTHFEFEPGTTGVPRLKCVEGTNVVKTVALNMQGLSALIEQGLLRKPGAVKFGALHDWVELDGQLFRFHDGPDGLPDLQRLLNDQYVVRHEEEDMTDVRVSENPASPTGFDLEFPASPSGLVETRKRHLDDETIQLLQNQEKCRVLRKGIIVKLVPPSLVFKMQTSDHGECYLEPGVETTVRVFLSRDQIREIDLSKPVNLLDVGVPELTAILNHPAINRKAYLTQSSNRG